MPVTNTVYCTTQELLTYIGSNRAVDDKVEWAVAAASRWIDDYCGRTFSNDDTASAKVFQAVNGYCAKVDDFHTTSGLIVKTDSGDSGTFDITWSSTDFELEPLNGHFAGLSGFPYHQIGAVEAYTFPVYGRRKGRLQVTAKWGWAAVPDAVFQACLIVAQEMHRLNDAPFGVAGIDNFGPIRLRAENTRATALLEPYVRHDRRGLVAG